VRRSLVAALVIGVLAIPVLLWSSAGDEDRWVVRGDTADYSTADDACAELPGVKERAFSRTSDLPAGSLSEGVHWTVEGRDKADAVASCLEANGVPEVIVERERELQTFERTDP
jgi:hypothetical protein